MDTIAYDTELPEPACAGGAGVTFGTVASIRGGYVYVKRSSGNTIRVKLSSATRIANTTSASPAASTGARGEPRAIFKSYGTSAAAAAG